MFGVEMVEDLTNLGFFEMVWFSIKAWFAMAIGEAALVLGIILLVVGLVLVLFIFVAVWEMFKDLGRLIKAKLTGKSEEN